MLAPNLAKIPTNFRGLHGVDFCCECAFHAGSGASKSEMAIFTKCNLKTVKKLGIEGSWRGEWRESGTLVQFWPDEKYFDSVKFSVSALKSVLRASGFMPWFTREFYRRETGEVSRWFYEDGLKSYLQDRLDGALCLPEEPLIGSFSSDAEKADWAFTWLQGRRGHRWGKLCEFNSNDSRRHSC